MNPPIWRSLLTKHHCTFLKMEGAILHLSDKVKVFWGYFLKLFTTNPPCPSSQTLLNQRSRFIWVIFYSSYKTEAVGKVHSRQGWKKQGCYKTGSRCKSKSSPCREGRVKTLLAWPGQPSAKEKCFLPNTAASAEAKDLAWSQKSLAPCLVVLLTNSLNDPPHFQSLPLFLYASSV